MSNTSLLLESLALTKDAIDRLDKTTLGGISAIEAFHVAVVRYWLATAHEQLEDLLHDRAGRKS